MSTQTDEQEMTETSTQYSNKGAMTDDIQFNQVLTHDHSYGKPVEEFRPSSPQSIAHLSAEEWGESEGAAQWRRAQMLSLMKSSE